MKRLEGIMALTYTPFKQDYSLNEAAVRREIDWVIERGAVGVWPGTYAGQWPEMEEEVRKRHLKVVIDHAGKRVLCAAGCHATNTLQTIRLVNYADKLGYDCAWISPTAPRKATEEEVYLHHKMVLEETGLPLALYDSSPVGTYMGPDLVAGIVAMSDRFIAMKAIVSDVCHIAGLYNLGLGEKLAIFGVEWNMLPHLLLGASGAMGGSDWIPVMSAAYTAFKAGDMKKAWALQKEIVAQSPLLIPRIAAMAMGAGLDHSAVGYMKAKFSIMSGIDMGPPLPPYLPASKDELEKAKKGIAALNRMLEEAG